jgi:hypothetical protein
MKLIAPASLRLPNRCPTTFGTPSRRSCAASRRWCCSPRWRAIAGAEYEWGVHVSVFAAKAGLTEAQITSLTIGGPEDTCWSNADRLLIRLCDRLHEDCTVDDALWAELTRHHSDEALLELLMLAGTYRTVSYLVNSLRLPAEPGARRFPPARAN